MIRIDNMGKQYFRMREEVDAAVHKVLESGWYIMGQELESFEREFARYIGCRFAVGVASGTDALALALMALGIGRGCNVITSAMTAFPTITGIMKAGATPVVVDVNYEDGLMDMSRLEEMIDERTKAIIPVHLYGQSCDLDPLSVIAIKHGLKIVEDCAQSVGASYKGKKTGCFGAAGAFSFYPTKNLGGYGDGGAVVTNEEPICEKLLRLRNYGKSSRDNYIEYGFNSRLDELQAAVLRVKLAYLESWAMERRENASFYRENLKTVNCLRENGYGRPVYHQFVVQTSGGQRNRLQKYLEREGIQTLVHYPKPVTGQKAFPKREEKTLKNAVRFAGNILSLPVYPELTEQEKETIVGVINAFK